MKKFIYDPKLIEQKNEAFHKLSNKQKRLAIAKDALQQLKLGKFRAMKGIYHKLKNDGGYIYGLESKDLQKALLEKNPTCNVCGLGAAFVSLSRLGNEVLWSYSDRDQLKPIFGKEQIDLIETSFEGWKSDQCSRRLFDWEFTQTRSFYLKYRKSQERLAAIFRNIIKNDGTFKP